VPTDDTAPDGYGPDHLPYGVILRDGVHRPAVRLGQDAVDLRVLAHAGLLGEDTAWVDAADLTPFLAAGRPTWEATREAVRDRLESGAVPDEAIVPLAELPAQPLPFTVADYVDFYSSVHHATNVGRLFRPEDPDPLPPAWRHLPIGYHGRAGTVVPSGTSIRRPRGQVAVADGTGPPSYGPTRQLDLELEVGFVVGGPPSPLGQPVPTSAAIERIMGIVLVNDWSARDIQAWEYRPLGPFLGKSFATSIGCWITPLAALGAAWRPPPSQDPPPLPHLWAEGDWALALDLEVAITPAEGDTAHVISRTTFADMWWTMPQQLAHATSNGAATRPGDLYASGTVSGPDRGTEGSLLELSRGGREPIPVGEQRRGFLEDGDTVTLRGSCPAVDGGRLTLAEVVGMIRPA
jgi:fumarylacetoacetase